MDVEAIAGTANWQRGPRVNYIGIRAGKLVSVTLAGKARDGHQLLRCLCDCGKEVLRKSNVLVKNNKEGVDSHCGCSPTKANLTHGGRNTPEYRVWQGIKRRCLNPSNKDYPRYGGAGIGIADSLRDDFAAFLAEVGPRPSEKHQIDRIDNTRGYEPGNIRWATSTVNNANKRSSYQWFVRGLAFDSSTDAAKHFGVSVQTIFKWTDGYMDNRRGTWTKPRPDCARTLRYAS